MTRADVRTVLFLVALLSIVVGLLNHSFPTTSLTPPLTRGGSSCVPAANLSAAAAELPDLQSSGTTARSFFGAVPPHFRLADAVSTCGAGDAPDAACTLAAAAAALSGWLALERAALDEAQREPVGLSPFADDASARLALLGVAALRVTCPALLLAAAGAGGEVVRASLQLFAVSVERWAGATAAQAPFASAGAPGAALAHPLHPVVRRSLGEALTRIERGTAAAAAAARSSVPVSVTSALAALSVHAFFDDGAVELALQPLSHCYAEAEPAADCCDVRLIFSPTGKPWETSFFDEIVPERLEWRSLQNLSPIDVDERLNAPPADASAARRCAGSATPLIVIVQSYPSEQQQQLFKRLAEENAASGPPGRRRRRAGVLFTSDELMQADAGHFGLWVGRQYYRPARSGSWHNMTSPTTQRELIMGLGYRSNFWDAAEARSDAARWPPVLAASSELARDTVRRSPLAARPWPWAFIGDTSKSNREAILETIRTNGFKLVAQVSWTQTAASESPEASAPHVRSAYSRAMFVPTPDGNFNVDTFRFYEALEAGALPVVLVTGGNQPGQRYWDGVFGEHHPILHPASWSSAGALMAQLRRPDMRERLEAYHQQVVDWWLTYKWSLRRVLAIWMRED